MDSKKKTMEYCVELQLSEDKKRLLYHDRDCFEMKKEDRNFALCQYEPKKNPTCHNQSNTGKRSKKSILHFGDKMYSKSRAGQQIIFWYLFKSLDIAFKNNGLKL